MIMRIREPKTTALIFASGKMVRKIRCMQTSPNMSRGCRLRIRLWLLAAGVHGRKERGGLEDGSKKGQRQVVAKPVSFLTAKAARHKSLHL